MNHEAFQSGKFDTKFIDKYFTPEHLFTKDGEADLVAALVGQEVFDGMQTLNQPDSHLGQRDGANTNRQQNSWQRNRTVLR